jgi:hypothetical protein
MKEHHTVLVDDVVRSASGDAGSGLGRSAHDVASLLALDGGRRFATTWPDQGDGSVAERSAAGRARRCGVARWPDLPLAGAAR